jgi:delta-aminolevulinic acid dehydratase/porphobilinogen synthase
MHHPTLRLFQNGGRNLTKSMLIYPIFISDDPDAEQEIATLPGQKRWGVNKLEGFLAPLVKKGLKGVILFGVPMEMEKVGDPLPQTCLSLVSEWCGSAANGVEEARVVVAACLGSPC